MNVHEKLLDAKIFLLAVTGVLATSQKKIACNGRHSTAGFWCVRPGVQPAFNKMVFYGDWDGEFAVACNQVTSTDGW